MAQELLLDPFQPILPHGGAAQEKAGGVRFGQRMRRAEIRAVIRRLLAEEGCSEVTVRSIASESGFALQTVYNLAGPRDQAITDAISEYSLHVGRMAARREPVPSLSNLVDMWIAGAESSPAFARQCNLIIFGPSRQIYYRFRDIQIRGMTKLLRLQKDNRRGFFHSSPRKVAEELVFFATALWIDWADRPFPLPILRQRLIAGLSKLAAS